eukprot:UN12506
MNSCLQKCTIHESIILLTVIYYD